MYFHFYTRFYAQAFLAAIPEAKVASYWRGLYHIFVPIEALNAHIKR